MNQEVLVLEDEPYTVDLTQPRLGTEGALVFPVTDARQSISLVGIVFPHWCYSISHGLPYSGFDLLRAICSTPTWQEIPVITLTATGRPESIHEATTLGAAEYLKKPFAPDRLLQVVDSLIPVLTDPSSSQP